MTSLHHKIKQESNLQNPKVHCNKKTPKVASLSCDLVR